MDADKWPFITNLIDSMNCLNNLHRTYKNNILKYMHRTPSREDLDVICYNLINFIL